MIKKRFKSELTGKTYLVLSKLGSGQYGMVYLICDEEKNKYALKLVDMNELKRDKKMVILFNNEIKIMKNIKHPRILHLHDKLKLDSNIGLITNYCDGGNLEDLILEKYKNGVSEEKATFYLKQIAEGFAEMEKKKIIHRDLKLANIFLNKNNCVIGDFGFAKIGVSLTKTKLGTPYYMAPEILNSNKFNYYSNKIDIWSIGICYYYLIFGFMPFKDAKNKLDLLNLEMKYSGSRLRFFKAKKPSKQVFDLLIKMIVFDDKKRISFTEFFDHPLVNLNTDFKNVNINFDNNTNILKNNKSSEIPINNFPNNFNESHSQKLNSSVKTIDSLLSKSLSDYLYNKNILIFMVDTIKKVQICEKQKRFNLLFCNIFLLEIVLIRKAIIFNTRNVQTINNNQNIFSLSNFESIKISNEYKMLKKFFNNFQNFILNLNDQTKKLAKSFFKKPKIQLKDIDTYNIKKLNEIIIDCLREMLNFFRDKESCLDISNKTELMKSIIYCFFNIDIFTKFPNKSIFHDFLSWQAFCEKINKRNYREIKKKMFKIYNL